MSQGMTDLKKKITFQVNRNESTKRVFKYSDHFVCTIISLVLKPFKLNLVQNLLTSTATNPVRSLNKQIKIN